MKKNELEHSTIVQMNNWVEYIPGGIVSKQVIKQEKGNITLFAFDKGEGLSEHTAPFDALVQVLDGKVTISIDGLEYQLTKGDSIIMPAGIPHALKAIDRFKMLLTMIRSGV